MVIPKYSSWILDGMSEEQLIASMKATILPALIKLSDGTPPSNLMTANPWLSVLCSTSANDEVDEAYRNLPNAMTMVLSEFVDTLYGTTVTVKFQRRLDEGLIEQNW